jgi:exodeoxyribonuclease VII large subunit
MEIYHFDVSVQGENSIKEIVSGFEYFNENKEKLNVDLIVLTRGGGSLEDLRSFNSREVAYAVFGSLVPVVCGVGHEQDFTLADYVSDLRASTPSNAAELISTNKKDIIKEIDSKVYRISNEISSLASSANKKIVFSMDRAEDFIREKINNFHYLYSSFFGNLRIFEQKAIIQKTSIENAERKLDLFKKRVGESKKDVENILRVVSGFDPKAVLKRGYSITKLNGKVVSSVKKIRKNDVVDVSLSDGEFSSEVLSLKIK